MREIKFRAWDIKNKKIQHMFEVTQMEFSETEWLFGDLEDDEHRNTIYGSSGSVLMQFTGLTDKDNKEIYEGDIVTFEINSFSYVGEIKFEHGCFIITCNEIEDSYVKLCDLDIEEDSFWQVRLLGNIYENPELLDAKVEEGVTK